MSFKNWRGMLKVWAPPLIGIAAMLLLGYGVEAARFFLFAHHLFWIIGIILLINPVAETLWPSATYLRKGQPAPRPSAKARARAEAHKPMAQQKPAPASETPAERLARLKKQKEVIDQKIEKLNDPKQERLK